MDYFVVELKENKTARTERSRSVAIPLEIVRQVLTINPTNVCPIPGVKLALLGVVNQKGKLLWLLDLASLLTIEEKSGTHLNKLTVLITKYAHKNTCIERSRNVGLVVSRLKEIITTEHLSIEDTKKDHNLNNNYLENKIILENKNTIDLINIDSIYDYINY